MHHDAPRTVMMQDGVCLKNTGWHLPMLREAPHIKVACQTQLRTELELASGVAVFVHPPQGGGARRREAGAATIKANQEAGRHVGCPEAGGQPSHDL